MNDTVVIDMLEWARLFAHKRRSARRYLEAVEGKRFNVLSIRNKRRAAR